MAGWKTQKTRGHRDTEALAGDRPKMVLLDREIASTREFGSWNRDY